MAEIREIAQAFEETTRRNIETVIAFSNETREIVRNLEGKIQRIEGMIQNNLIELQQLRGMLAQLQAKAFAGGSTDVDQC